MKIINLLPKEEQKQLKLDAINRHLRVFWAIIFISIALFAAMGFAAQQYVRFTLKSVDSQIAEKKEKLEGEEIRNTQAQVLKLNQHIKEIKSIRDQQYKWSEVLMELARVVPSDAQINSLQIDRSTGEIIILGKAKNREGVLAVWEQLKRSQLFYNVNFPLPNLEQPTNSNFTYTFFVHLDKIKHDEFKN